MMLFSFTSAEASELLTISRSTLKQLFFNNNQLSTEAVKHQKLFEKYGVFVSLYHQQSLRGCIGTFISNEPLFQGVINMTKHAATNDYRFDPINKHEIDQIEIEISILSPLEKITSLDDFELGKHGIYIKKGAQSGTFLPQVALKTNWTKEEFVNHCSNDKAGLGYTGWKNADLYRYEAFIIKESKYLKYNNI